MQTEPSRLVSRIFYELYISGKFMILAKFWISIETRENDPKFHGDHEYLFEDSPVVEQLSLTSGKCALN